MADQKGRRPTAVQNEERGVTLAEEQGRVMRRVAELVADRQGQLTSLLAGQVDPERFITVALQAVQGSPKLLECTPLSILASIRDAATYGLEPAGMLGDASLVPYYDSGSGQTQAQLQIEYRGYRKLSLRDGTVAVVDADLVYPKDAFRLVSGSNPAVEHEPSLDAERLKDEPRGGYAWARFANGEVVHLWMALSEILKRRDASKAYRYAESARGGHDSIWHKWPGEMMKKTVLRRLILEKLPLSPIARQAIAADTMRDVDDGRVPEVRVTQTAGDARARILERMGLANGERSKALEAGDANAAADTVTPAADGSRSSAAAEDAGNGAPEPQEPAESAQEAKPLCGAESPYGDGDTCRKLAEHEGEPGGTRKMHAGVKATWERADPDAKETR